MISPTGRQAKKAGDVSLRNMTGERDVPGSEAKHIMPCVSDSGARRPYPVLQDRHQRE
jgi:hypothetical protein